MCYFFSSTLGLVFKVKRKWSPGRFHWDAMNNASYASASDLLGWLGSLPFAHEKCDQCFSCWAMIDFYGFKSYDLLGLARVSFCSQHMQSMVSQLDVLFHWSHLWSLYSKWNGCSGGILWDERIAVCLFSASNLLDLARASIFCPQQMQSMVGCLDVLFHWSRFVACIPSRKAAAVASIGIKQTVDTLARLRSCWDGWDVSFPPATNAIDGWSSLLAVTLVVRLGLYSKWNGCSDELLWFEAIAFCPNSVFVFDLLGLSRASACCQRQSDRLSSWCVLSLVAPWESLYFNWSGSPRKLHYNRVSLSITESTLSIVFGQCSFKQFGAGPEIRQHGASSREYYLLGFIWVTRHLFTFPMGRIPFSLSFQYSRGRLG